MKKRIFVAASLSSSLLRKIERWKEKIKVKNSNLRFIKPQNLHLTLIPPWYEERLEKIEKIFFSTKFRKAKVSFNSVEIGPTRSKPRLIWLKGKADKNFYHLLEKAAETFGKSVPRRNFAPHVTLTRFAAKKVRKKDLEKLETKVAWRENLSSLCVLQSLLSPKGAQYKILYKTSLKATLTR